MTIDIFHNMCVCVCAMDFMLTTITLMTTGPHERLRAKMAEHDEAN